ncbi:hypothetical protein DFH27DRAFT_321698 [Peziza echinospora]|nr:hypothetical protein DFH27DRAFT_321698 [Peziza echinospora]
MSKCIQRWCCVPTEYFYNSIRAVKLVQHQIRPQQLSAGLGIIPLPQRRYGTTVGGSASEATCDQNIFLHTYMSREGNDGTIFSSGGSLAINHRIQKRWWFHNMNLDLRMVSKCGLKLSSGWGPRLVRGNDQWNPKTSVLQSTDYRATNYLPQRTLLVGVLVVLGGRCGLHLFCGGGLVSSKRCGEGCVKTSKTNTNNSTCCCYYHTDENTIQVGNHCKNNRLTDVE